MTTKYECLFRKCDLRRKSFRQEFLQSTFHAAVVLCGLTALAGTLRAQEIKNPSFESPALATGKPLLSAPSEQLAASGWTFGFFSGICRQNVGFAKGLSAANGSQVAYLRGDPRKLKAPGKQAQRLIVGYISGLKADEDYEIQWAEASSTTDISHGALTVILRDKEDLSDSGYLQQNEPVKNKGEWARKSLRFTASGPEMNLYIRHSVPQFGSSDATGEETTLLDDFRITPVPKKADQ
jgi:hypothetical protein